MIMSSSRKVLCLSPRSSKVLVVRTWCRRIGTLPTASAGKRSSHQARSLILNHLTAQSAPALGTLEQGISSISSKALQTPLSLRHYCSTARRPLSSSDPTASSMNTSKKDGHDDDDGDETPTPTSKPEKVLLYKAPMGDLVTRLKRISITSCLVSIIGLPALIYLKNGTWPDMKQIGMGGFAFVSATGSTLALHFVFGPYVLELCEIPIRKCHTAKDGGGGGGGEEEEEEEVQTTKKEQERAAQEYLYQATTRSILGWKREIVFDPLTDVTKYAGARPFANFIAKKEFVLYCHPELLDADTRQKLLNPKQEEGVGGGESEEDAEAKKKKEQIRRPVDEEDGFL